MLSRFLIVGLVLLFFLAQVALAAALPSITLTAEKWYVTTDDMEGYTLATVSTSGTYTISTGAYFSGSQSLAVTFSDTGYANITYSYSDAFYVKFRIYSTALAYLQVYVNGQNLTTTYTTAVGADGNTWRVYEANVSGTFTITLKHTHTGFSDTFYIDLVEINRTSEFSWSFDYQTVEESNLPITYYNSTLNATGIYKIILNTGGRSVVTLTGGDWSTYNSTAILISPTSSTVTVKLKKQGGEDYAFFYVKFDNGTEPSGYWYEVDYGAGYINKTDTFFYVPLSSLGDVISVKRGTEDWLRHYRPDNAIYISLPTPGKTYTKVSFTVLDYTGEFQEDSWLVFEKGGQVIEEEPIQQSTVLAFLEAYEYYTIKVIKGDIVRSIGAIIIDSASKTITIGLVVEPPRYFFNTCSLVMYLDNNTQTIYCELNETSGVTVTATFSVYVLNNGTLLYTTSASGTSLLFAYVLPDPVLDYKVVLNVTHPEYGNLTFVRVFGVEQSYNTPTRIGNFTRLFELWAGEEIARIAPYIVGALIVVIVALVFAYGFAEIGLVATGVTIVALTYAGLLPLTGLQAYSLASLLIITAIIKARSKQ